MRSKILGKLLMAFALLLFAVPYMFGQTTSVLTTGLSLPNKMTAAPDEKLLVSEAGMMAPNTGRITIVDQFTGDKQALISGLPSAVSELGGSPTPSGPSGLLLRGNKLYVTIGVGDAVLPGAMPPLEDPNPTPSSPLFDSVLELTLPGGYQQITEGFEMTMADQNALANSGHVQLMNSLGQWMHIRLVADIDNYIPFPIGDEVNNVKASNLYGVEIFQTNLYVVDAGLNRIHKVSLKAGSYETFIQFATIPNPTPVGAPVIEPVPDAILRFGNTLLVPNLTGFPFVPGLSSIKAVGLKGAEERPLISGLTSAIDVIKARGIDGDDEEFAAYGASYFTLEFSVDQLSNAPGRLSFYATATSDPVFLVEDLITPSAMVQNPKTGDIFVSEIFTGNIIRVSDLP